MMIWVHSLPFGKAFFDKRCAKKSMINPATANLTWAITNGWEEPNAILVAVDAEAHKNAKTIPATIHLYSCLIILALLSSNKNMGKA